MSVLIKHMAMPKGCIYANDKDQTDYCPMLNHDDVPFCQYIENEPESAIGIDERPVYCPLSDVPDTNVGDMISRKVAMEMLMAQNVIMYGSEYHNGFNAGVNRAQEVIRNLSPVQPKRGKWIERGTWSEGEGMGETYGKRWACSRCGREVKGLWDECGKNFCDNCGADMRGNTE